jgi:allantoate deiminase
MPTNSKAAQQVLERCDILALLSEEPEFITRTFLSEPMHRVHLDLTDWMKRAGMTVTVDGIGNLRGYYPAAKADAPRLIIGSHLDTVPQGGAYDGILGVMMGVALVELLDGRRLNFAIELVGFSEEEGVRFGIPFIGSRALAGELDMGLLSRCDPHGTSVEKAILDFGLNPADISNACVAEDAAGYLEFHIEQGPVLEDLNLPLGVVTAINGQSRMEVVLEGKANHAGTTPMNLRRDALAGAAEWIGAVEREAISIPGLAATIGKIEAQPGAVNIIPGSVWMSLDVRHQVDEQRVRATAEMLRIAHKIASRRQLGVSSHVLLSQQTVAMDGHMSDALSCAMESSGYGGYRMQSGAGHDAMIMAKRLPVAMLFLRSPGGISHHPDERVNLEDVEAALATGMRFLETWEPNRA